MVQDFDQFSKAKKDIDNQISGLKKKKLKTTLDQYNKKKQEIQQKMNKFVNGASSF